MSKCLQEIVSESANRKSKIENMFFAEPGPQPADIFGEGPKW